MSIYSIGAGGLRKLGPSKIKLLPNHAYYLGASSSPSRVIVTSVGENRFTYRSFPYQGRDIAIEAAIGLDLIEQGCRTRHAMTKVFAPEEAAWLARVLDGGPGEPDDPARWVPVRWRVQPVKPYKGDPWYWAEEYGGVGGVETDNGYAYEIDGYMKDAAALAADPRFVIVSTEPR